MSIYIARVFYQESSPKKVSLLLYESSNEINEGTEKLFEIALKEIGIDANPISWDITLCRSDYFTDYLDSDVWEDVWQLHWLAEVTIDREVKLDKNIINSLIELDVSDESYSVHSAADEESITNCLILLDFDSENELKEAQVEIRNNNPDLSKEYMLDSVVKDYIELAPQGYYQLILDLGKVKASFYDEGAKYALLIKEIAETKGGTSHFLKRL